MRREYLTDCPKCRAREVGAMAPLTKRQRAILDYLREHIGEYGFAPTLKEISERFGFKSLGTTHEHMGNLESKGWIRRGFNRARAITLVEPVARA